MLGPGVDASWGGEESQDLGAGVLVGRSFWGERSGLNTPWHLAPCSPRAGEKLGERRERVYLSQARAQGRCLQAKQRPSAVSGAWAPQLIPGAQGHRDT